MGKLVKTLVIILIFVFAAQVCIIGGNSILKSNEVLAKQTEQDSEPPTAPSDIGLVSKTDTAVEFSWNESEDNVGVVCYKVYEGENLIGEVDTTLYQAQELLPSTEYNFTVVAKDEAGNTSNASEPLIVVTEEGEPEEDELEEGEPEEDRLEEGEPEEDELEEDESDLDTPDEKEVLEPPVELSVGNGTGLLGRYFGTNDFNSLAFIRTDSGVNFDWGSDSPGSGLDKNNFSIRWTGEIEPQVAGEHTFYVNAGGGVRLWIDGQLIIEGNRPGHPEEYDGTVLLNEGQRYSIKLEYCEINSKALIQLMWSCSELVKQVVPVTQLYPEQVQQPISSGQGRGLKGEYYNGQDLDSFVLDRLDPQVNFNWDKNSPASGVDRKKYSVRWSGKLEPRFTGEYTLYVEANDGIKLWLDNNLLIDQWHNGNAREYSVQTYLSAGNRYNIRIEYISHNGKSSVKLLWSGNEQVKEIIPSTQLYPVGLVSFISADATETETTLVWESSSLAMGYDLEVDGSVIENIQGATYTITGLEPGSLHVYRVRARSGSVVDKWSEPVSKWTVPDTVIGVEVLAGETDITVSWDEAAGATGYDMNINGAIIENITGPFAHTGLMPGTEYSVSIRAKNSSGIGKWSEQVLIWTLPIPPQSITQEATETQTTTSWSDVTGATGYDIEVDGTIYEDTVSPYVHDGLQPGTDHIYRIRAKNSSGCGRWSELLHKWTIPPAVEVIDTFATQTQMVVSWDEVQGAEYYDVEFDGVLIEDQLFSYTQENLQPGTEHRFRVRAKNDSGAGIWSEELTKWTVPDLVKDISNQTTEIEVTVSWADVIGATGYDMEIDNQLIENTISPFVHDGLEPGTRHTYRIRAKNSSGNGFWNDTLEVWTLPGAVEEIEVEAFQNETILQWNPVRGATGYDVEADGIIEENIPGPYVHAELVPGTLHTYRVRARNSSGTGVWSEQVSKWTLPGVVENMSAEATETMITLAWDNVMGADGYDIEVDGELIENVTSTYIHEGLIEGTSHTYRLRAKNSSGVGFWSDEIIKWTLPGIPQNVELLAGEDHISASWDDVTGAAAYDIEIDGMLMEDMATPCTVSELIPGKEYTLRVRAKNESGQGKWSEENHIWTIPGLVDSIGADASQTWISANWNVVTGASGYDIEVDGTVVVDVSSPYMLDGQLPGTEHIFRIRAKNSSGEGRWSEEFSKWTIPGVPENLNAQSTSSYILAAWDSVTGATGYDIEILGTPADTGGQTSYTHYGLNPNTQYVYRVRAKNSSGEGEWSGLIAKTTLPSAPVYIETDIVDKSITISWEAVSGAAQYDIEADGIIIEGLDKPQYLHEGLAPNTIHTYRIRAGNNDGKSEWSRMVNCTTLLPAPENVETVSSSSGITVTWDEVEGATGYDIKVDGTIINNGSGTIFNHMGLGADSRHTYAVRATDPNGSGIWSTEKVVFTLLAPPSGIKEDITSTQISVKWGMVAGATAYDIEVDGEIIDNRLSTVYSHNNLQPFSDHTYRVRSWNNAGAGEWSELIELTTLIGTPESLNALSTSSEITLTWDVVPGAEGYEIMVDGESVGTIASNSYVHLGLKPNSLHVYKVRAIRGNTQGEWCENITASTLVGVPTNLASLAESRQIRIAWDEVEGSAGYEVEIDSVLIESGPDAYYVYAGVEPNTVYTWRVRAKNEAGTSGWSEYVECITPPDIPVNFTAEATTTEITLAWDEAEGAAAYDLEVDGKVVEDLKDNTYTHTGLRSNSRHTYRIRAKNGYSQSVWSEKLVQVTTPEIEVPVKKDVAFNFVMVVPQKAGASERRVIVTYNPNELEVFDLCAVTPEPETGVGDIEGTNIKVLEFTPGRVVYSIGNPDRTTVNIVKFLSKANGHSNVTYTIR